jgi:acyl dehydratase
VSTATVLVGLDGIRAAVGRHLGYSDWLVVDQARIDQFAHATGDQQWIHVDPAAAGDGPFGTTIAHGYLTLSLSNYFLPQIVDVQGVSMGINYGTGRVRFPAPVPVGSRLRAGAELIDAAPIDGGIQTTVVITLEVEGQTRPACVIESLSRYLS